MQFRKEGGLSLPEARLSVTDEAQMNAPDFGLQNVGVVKPGRLSNDSLHPTYSDALPGEPLGELKEDPDSVRPRPETSTEGQPTAIPRVLTGNRDH